MTSETTVPERFAKLLERLASDPPHPNALGFRLVTLDGTEPVMVCPYRDDLVGDPETGVVAGGVVTALLDHICGMAVWTAMGRLATIATLDLRIDYLRAAQPRRDLMARARCHKLGQTFAFVRASAYEDDPDDPVAAATAVLMAVDGSSLSAAGRDGAA